MAEERHTLQRIDRPGRSVYELAGHALSGGDVIELCFSGGWVAGQYTWTGDLHDRPQFHYSIETVNTGEVVQGSLEIPEDARLRWSASSP